MELKPCPFCGGAAELRSDHGPDYMGGGLRYVRCKVCWSEGRKNANMNADATERAVNDWNRRAEAPARAAAQPVAVFDGYIDGGAAVIQWRGQGLPVGTLLYAAPGPTEQATPMYDACQAQYVRAIADYLKRDGMPNEAKFLQDLAFQLEAAAVTILNGK